MSEFESRCSFSFRIIFWITDLTFLITWRYFVSKFIDPKKYRLTKLWAKMTSSDSKWYVPDPKWREMRMNGYFHFVSRTSLNIETGYKPSTIIDGKFPAIVVKDSPLTLSVLTIDVYSIRNFFFYYFNLGILLRILC